MREIVEAIRDGLIVLVLCGVLVFGLIWLVIGLTRLIRSVRKPGRNP